MKLSEDLSEQKKNSSCIKLKNRVALSKIRYFGFKEEYHLSFLHTKLIENSVFKHKQNDS